MEKTHQVRCTKCGGESTVKIHPVYGIVEWTKIGSIVSGRKRLDTEWGWDCKCGNYSIITEQERQTIKNLQQPSPQDLAEVKNNLVLPKIQHSTEGVIIDNFILKEV